MDYTIEFILSPADTSRELLLRVSLAGSGTEERDGRFVFEGGMVVTPGPEASGVTCERATDAGMYQILSRYFDQAGEDGGALVSRTGTPALTMIAITTDDDAEIGETPLGFNIRAEELLASEAVFRSAWPGLSEGPSGDLPDTSEEEDVTMTGRTDKEMIFADILSPAGDESQTLSFLFFEATPIYVTQNVVRVPYYQQMDPEFLIYKTAEDDDPIEAVSFQTSEGSAVESRLPVTMADTERAIAAMAAAIPPNSTAKLCFVMDIIDSEETFIIQPISTDGSLGEPRRIKLM